MFKYTLTFLMQWLKLFELTLKKHRLPVNPNDKVLSDHFLKSIDPFSLQQFN